MKIALKVILTGLFLFLLASCTTQGYVAKQVEKNVQSEWQQKAFKPNQKAGKFEYYLPKDFSIEKNGINNAILKDKTGRPYILFVNSNEGPKSQLNYKNDLLGLKKGDTKKIIPSKSSFSYMIIRRLENKQYELIVSQGGVKMSTKASINELPSLSKVLAIVVHSVKH